jgi:7-dehydrocholesterol reductase
MSSPITTLTILFAIFDAIPTPFSPSAIKMVLSFTSFQLFLTRFVPGPLFEGPITPAGNTPIYKANGMTCYIITLLTTLIIDLTGSFDLSKVHSEFGEVRAARAPAHCHTTPRSRRRGTMEKNIYTRRK